MCYKIPMSPCGVVPKRYQSINSISRTYLVTESVREWIYQGKRPLINFLQLSDPPKYDHSDSKTLPKKSEIQKRPSQNPKRPTKIPKIGKYPSNQSFLAFHPKCDHYDPKTFPKKQIQKDPPKRPPKIHKRPQNSKRPQNPKIRERDLSAIFFSSDPPICNHSGNKNLF